VGKLAEWVGRDYTTVSRQVAKLEELDLVARRTSKTDARVTEAVVTEKGQAISDMLDGARERLARNALAGWSRDDLAEFARLLRGSPTVWRVRRRSPEAADEALILGPSVESDVEARSTTRR
jgi:DNA-binding MarR family transcriptional regulator